MSRYLICIDGIDGSGKSSLGCQLVQAASQRGLDAALLKVDDFRQPTSWNELSPAQESQVYYEQYYDFDALDACLADWLAGADGCSVPHFDSLRGASAGHRALDFRGRHVMIVEGVFLLRAPHAGRGALLYIATSYTEARSRILQRDRSLGRSVAEIERRIERRYFPGQRRYHAEHRPQERAHVVIGHERIGHLTLRRAEFDSQPPALAGLLRSVLPE